MAAALEIAPQLHDGRIPGLPPTPNVKIPEKFAPGPISDETAHEKGGFMEERIAITIRAHPKVQEVIQHSKNGLQDTRGHDMTVFFTDESGIAPVHIQSKSRPENLAQYINKISKRLRDKGSTIKARDWLIMDRTIPILGSKENEQFILYDFIMGLGLIIKRYDLLRKKYDYIDLFPGESSSTTAEPTQVLPELPLQR